MKNQKSKICLNYKKEYSDHSVSRKDNKTEICFECGINEAISDYLKFINFEKYKLENMKIKK